MTPKERAEYLVDRIVDIMFELRDGYNGGLVYEASKHCALVTLRETVWGYLDLQPLEVQNYWQKVEKEINNL